MLDKPLPTRGAKNEVSLSAFGFLLSELIQYSQDRVNTAEELEQKCACMIIIIPPTAQSVHVHVHVHVPGRHVFLLALLLIIAAQARRSWLYHRPACARAWLPAR